MFERGNHMWVFLNNSFLSIVDPATDGKASEQLLVRARFKGDIERVWPGVVEEHIPHRDYRWRALISRDDVVAAISSSVQNIDYHNFKGSVDENWRHDVYLDVWHVMFRAQEMYDNRD